MDFLKSNKIKIKLLDKLESLSKSNYNKFKKEFKSIFITICNALNFPENIIKLLLKNNDSTLKYHIFWKYFSNTNIIFKLSNYNFFKKLNKEKIKNEIHISAIPLESFGYDTTIPGIEIYTSNSSYIFFNNKPYILSITENIKYSERYEDKWFLESRSEQSWIDRYSLILISALNLSIDKSWFNFLVGDCSYCIPLKLNNIKIKKINKNNIHRIKNLLNLYEYVYIKTDDKNKIDINSFSFNNKININKINLFIQKINIKNHILMRCLYYFSKACSLSCHSMFIEEATALLYFTLDGLVKLFMKKYRIKEVKKISKLLKTKFNFECHDYIDDCYDNRTSYVHPDNEIFYGWCPPFMGDDYYETLDFVRDLIKIYLLEQYIPPEKLLL